MAFTPRTFGYSLLICLSLLGAERALAHGDVTPQPVDTTGLDPLGPEWRDVNPYRGNAVAEKIGKSGFAQNCARCHGIEAESGGIAPDLRYLDKAGEGDAWFINRIRHGYTQNGLTKMPAFEGILSQEAMWAIRTYLDSRYQGN
ncbi:cytochrome c-550 PedF [Rhodoblastus sp.]|uniref:cytochrome c-550 PedF n=1 Tax=Rhodoblastus sp. TaxID=1962975 RepID=UPI003F97E1FA